MTMKSRFFATMAVCMMTVAALANDGVFFVNGNQLVPLQENSISIEKEVLTISIGNDGYASIDVDYVLNNRGAAKTVVMGFEACAPYNDEAKINREGKHPYIDHFTVTMNGQQLDYRNAIVASADGQGSDFKPLDLNQWKTTEGMDFEQSNNLYDVKADSIVQFAYAYYFTANFNKGRNNVHHTYRYRMSYGVGRTFEIPYWLKPAMRWANHQIDDFTLRVKADGCSKHICMADSLFRAVPFNIIGENGKCRIIKRPYGEQMVEATLRNATLEWHARNFRPTDNMLIQSADIIYAFEKNARLGDFYDANEHYVPSWKAWPDNKFNAWEKRILRNLPYASRGYVFKDKKLQAYFNKTWWYMPDPRVQATSDDFTAREREIVKMGK